MPSKMELMIALKWSTRKNVQLVGSQDPLYPGFFSRFSKMGGGSSEYGDSIRYPEYLNTTCDNQWPFLHSRILKHSYCVAGRGEKNQSPSIKEIQLILTHAMTMIPKDHPNFLPSEQAAGDNSKNEISRKSGRNIAI